MYGFPATPSLATVLASRADSFGPWVLYFAIDSATLVARHLSTKAKTLLSDLLIIIALGLFVWLGFF